MKNWLFITVVAVFFALSSPTSFSIENHAIMNPAGLSTVPPSSIQSGLISNPNPIDTSGNLVITGNVRHGRHFRDTVPYGSTTTFRASLGSSSLSSFLRDSAGAEDFGHYAGKYSIQPYYSRSQTVTTTRPGYSGVFRPVTRINDRTPQGQYSVGTRVSGLEKQSLSSEGFSTWAGTSREPSVFGLQEPQTQYGTSAKPLQIVKSIRELQLLTRDEAGISPQDQKLMVERYQEQTQDTRLQTGIHGPGQIVDLLFYSLKNVRTRSVTLALQVSAVFIKFTLICLGFPAPNFLQSELILKCQILHRCVCLQTC